MTLNSPARDGKIRKAKELTVKYFIKITKIYLK
jgi:hypothetical protein